MLCKLGLCATSAWARVGPTNVSPPHILLCVSRKLIPLLSQFMQCKVRSSRSTVARKQGLIWLWNIHRLCHHAQPHAFHLDAKSVQPAVSGRRAGDVSHIEGKALVSSVQSSSSLDFLLARVDVWSWISPLVPPGTRSAFSAGIRIGGQHPR